MERVCSSDLILCPSLELSHSGVISKGTVGSCWAGDSGRDMLVQSADVMIEYL